LWREISDLISRWITGHILEHDLALAAYFRAASTGASGFSPVMDSLRERATIPLEGRSVPSEPAVDG
jgi:hypothetical protein